MRAVYQKELRQFFHSVVGYVFLAIFLFICGYYFSLQNLVYRSGDISLFFRSIITFLMFLVPLLTMRSFAEEKKLRTDQLLFTMPVSVSGVVLGKFFAAMTVFLTSLAVTLPFPLILAYYGSPQLWAAIGNYLAIILLVGAFMAIGVFVSAITENQVVAAILTYVVLFALWFSTGFAASTQNRAVAAVLQGISLLERYYEMTMGILNPASFLFYLTMIFVFLFLTIQVLEYRRRN